MSTRKKNSGDGVYVNGVLSGAHTGTTNFTADISPYLVFSSQKKTDFNYTKQHYENHIL